MVNVQNSLEKRRSSRIELDYFKVRLEWSDPRGFPRSQTASCVDISRHGVSFECPFPFELGSAISVTFNYDTDAANQVIGSVCRCSRLNMDNFHVALQIQVDDTL
nr:PilZ domain-containing protein [Parashewanella hymeniacidonis]